MFAELDIEGKREFEAKSPPGPPLKRNALNHSPSYSPYLGLRIRRLGVRLPFNLYELDMQGKREFEEKRPPGPRRNETAKGDPPRSRYTPSFTPGFTPSSLPVLVLVLNLLQLHPGTG